MGLAPFEIRAPGRCSRLYTSRELSRFRSCGKGQQSSSCRLYSRRNLTRCQSSQLLTAPTYSSKSIALFLMRPFFAFKAKKHIYTGVRTGCHYLISLSACLSVCLSVCLSISLSVCPCVCLSVCVCVTVVVFTDCESCRGRFPQNQDLWKLANMANTWDILRCTPSRGGRGRRAAVDFVACFGCGVISCFS